MKGVFGLSGHAVVANVLNTSVIIIKFTLITLLIQGSFEKRHMAVCD
jgi:hypothetical protein